MTLKDVTVEPSISGFDRIRLAEVEIGQPIPRLESQKSADGQAYCRALIFVRLHDEPLGLVEVMLKDGSLSPEDLARGIWPAIADRARDHLMRDGINTHKNLDSIGIHTPRGLKPLCITERTRYLDRAPHLTVLIPSRERPDRLRRCLDSILASEYPEDRIAIIIVDNAPDTDATRVLIKSYMGRANIRYLREDAPGSASARNCGIREVETEVVVMTDDDTLVDRHWLAAVAGAFESFPQASAVSGLLLPACLDTAPQVWFEQYGGFSRGFDRRVFDIYENWPADEPLFPWTTGLFGTGNNFAFRTDAIRAIGGFDPALGNGTPALGGVDSEIMLRTILSGHTIVYEPQAVVHHAHRPSYNALRRQLFAYGTGMIACHLKTLTTNPGLTLSFASKIPSGIRFAFSSSSPKNASKRVDYPRELTWLELRGMFYGPLAYARSRRRYGRYPVPRVMTPHSVRRGSNWREVGIR